MGEGTDSRWAGAGPTLVFRLGGIDRPVFVAACKSRELNYHERFVPYPDLRGKMMRRIDLAPAFIVAGFAGLVERAPQAGDFDVPQSRIVGVKSHISDEFVVVTTRVLGLDPTNVHSLTLSQTIAQSTFLLKADV